MARKQSIEGGSGKNRFGLFMALAFYFVSVVMVIINNSGSTLIDPETKVITIAHWHLEDGYREGMNEVIKLYEKAKAKEGIKVKIAQSTVPNRGYSQWFITQLISGYPADILLLRGSPQVYNQYFVPLSDYISEPNPYNRGTPLQGMPWKDTYIDGMNSTLDPIYAEYYGIGEYFHVLRMFVNKDLLKKATGNDRMPKTYDEWLDDCEKLRQYGKKTGIPIIPIGVRGIDKSTIATLFRQYYSQLNGHLNDTQNEFGEAVPNVYEQLEWLASDKVDRARMLQSVNLVKNVGKYFCKGFTSTDLEQTKFLFFTGNVGFFPEGTWNAWSLVKNSPFEVDVINIPVIGPKNQYYKNFTGQISELGVGIGSRFGIPKASKNFSLALDFLRFMTSYKMNQMLMVDYCKWPPAIIKAEYKGLLAKFKPVEGDGRLGVSLPFSLGQKSRTKTLEILENIIIKNISQPEKYFWQQFLGNLRYMEEEATAAEESGERQLFEISAGITSMKIGQLDSTLDEKSRLSLQRRELMMMENLIDRNRQRYWIKKGISALEKLKNHIDEVK